MLKQIEKLALITWESLQDEYPALVGVKCPTIRFNNRLTRTAGWFLYDIDVIELGAKFMLKYRAEMLGVILPHELAHAADFAIHGIPEHHRDFHRDSWGEIMNTLGIPANVFHSLDIYK